MQQGCKCRPLSASWGANFRQKLNKNNKVTCRLRGTTWIACNNLFKNHVSHAPSFTLESCIEFLYRHCVSWQRPTFYGDIRKIVAVLQMPPEDFPFDTYMRAMPINADIHDLNETISVDTRIPYP